MEQLGLRRRAASLTLLCSRSLKPELKTMRYLSNSESPARVLVWSQGSKTIIAWYGTLTGPPGQCSQRVPASKIEFTRAQARARGRRCFELICLDPSLKLLGSATWRPGTMRAPCLRDSKSSSSFSSWRLACWRCASVPISFTVRRFRLFCARVVKTSVL